MWKQLKIDDRTYFTLCMFGATHVECTLYDFNESWSERVELTAALHRAKQLNRRIQYDDETVRNTLQQYVPEHCNLEESDAGAHQSLKLKYRVRSCPLNFEWHLTKQTQEELRSSIIVPLFMAVNGMSEQIVEMRELLLKKDKEIGQYKAEGFVLKRTTVATQPFDADKFDKKYASVRALSASFQQMVEQFGTEFEKLADTVKAALSTVAVKTEDGDQDTSESKPPIGDRMETRISPRNRKRKALEAQQRHLQQNLKASKQKLEYENSQSFSQRLSQSLNENAEDSNGVAEPPVARHSPRVNQSMAKDEIFSDIEEELPRPEVTVEATNAVGQAEDVANITTDDISSEVFGILKAWQDLEERHVANKAFRTAGGTSSRN